MKNFLVIIITILMLGCVSPEDQARIDGATMFQAGMQKYNVNVEKVDAEFTAFENGDLQTMFDGTSDDLIWNSPQGDSLSKDVWMEGMKGWHNEFENFKFTNRQYYPGVDDSQFLPDGGVRTYGTWTFNHKATGTEFEQSYYSVQQFDDDGNTAFIWEFFDAGSIFLALQ